MSSASSSSSSDASSSSAASSSSSSSSSSAASSTPSAAEVAAAAAAVKAAEAAAALEIKKAADAARAVEVEETRKIIFAEVKAQLREASIAATEAASIAETAVKELEILRKKENVSNSEVEVAEALVLSTSLTAAKAKSALTAMVPEATRLDKAKVSISIALVEVRAAEAKAEDAKKAATVAEANVSAAKEAVAAAKAAKDASMVDEVKDGEASVIDTTLKNALKMEADALKELDRAEYTASDAVKMIAEANKKVNVAEVEIKAASEYTVPVWSQLEYVKESSYKLSAEKLAALAEKEKMVAAKEAEYVEMKEESKETVAARRAVADKWVAAKNARDNDPNNTATTKKYIKTGREISASAAAYSRYVKASREKKAKLGLGKN